MNASRKTSNSFTACFLAVAITERNKRRKARKQSPAVPLIGRGARKGGPSHRGFDETNEDFARITGFHPEGPALLRLAPGKTQ